MKPEWTWQQLVRYKDDRGYRWPKILGDSIAALFIVGYGLFLISETFFDAQDLYRHLGRLQDPYIMGMTFLPYACPFFYAFMGEGLDKVVRFCGTAVFCGWWFYDTIGKQLV